MHQVKMYINYWSFRGKRTTQKSHEINESVKLKNVN